MRILPLVLLCLAASASAAFRLGPELTVPLTHGARSNTELAGLVAREDGVMAFWTRPGADGKRELVAAPVSGDGIVSDDIRVVLRGISDGPARVIAAGDGYLAVWPSGPGRVGSLLTADLQVRANVPAGIDRNTFACNSSRCAFAYDTVFRTYTLDGAVAGQRAHSFFTPRAVAAAPEGFLSYARGDAAVMLDNDSRVMWGRRMPAPWPDVFEASVVRIAGGWLFAGKSFNDNHVVHTAVLTSAGDLIATRQFYPVYGTYVKAFASPNGSEVALISQWDSGFDRTEFPFYVMRIRSTLDPIDPLVPERVAIRWSSKPALATFHGEQLLAGWDDDGARIAAIGPRAPIADAAPLPVERGFVSQTPAAVAAAPGRYLGVWYENEGHNRRLLAARVDRSGHHLDASPIVLAGEGDEPQNATATAVGDDFVVLWQAGRAVRGVKIDGSIGNVSPLPFDGLGQLHARVVATGDGFAFAASDAAGRAIFEIDRQGRIAARRPLPYEPVDIAWAAGRVIATPGLDLRMRLASNGREVIRLRTAGYIEHLGADGNPIPGRTFRLRWSGEEGRLLLAPVGSGWLAGGGHGARSISVAMILNSTLTGGLEAGTLAFAPNVEPLDAVAAPGGHAVVLYERRLPSGTSLLLRELGAP